MDARARYDEIVDDLLHRHGEAERTQMMGMPCVKASGKLALGYSASDDSMVFKLTDDAAREQALTLEGAHLFDPSRQGRPMAKWVAVPPAHADEWSRLAETALTSRAG
jgi:hypothetical protein